VPYFSVAASSAAADDDEARTPSMLYNLVLGTTPTLLETDPIRDPIRDPPPTIRPRYEIPLIIFMFQNFQAFFFFLPVRAHSLSLSLSLPPSLPPSSQQQNPRPSSASPYFPIPPISLKRKEKTQN